GRRLTSAERADGANRLIEFMQAPWGYDAIRSFLSSRNSHELFFGKATSATELIPPLAGGVGFDTRIHINVDEAGPITVWNAKEHRIEAALSTGKTAFAHEISHALAADVGVESAEERPIDEWRATGLVGPIRPDLNENGYRESVGLPLRNCYYMCT